jgi:16S rRNA (guanine527-N7)-methyltransferase
MKNDERLWQQFATTHKLTEKQTEQFQKYYDLLCSWNEIHNITRITTLNDVLNYHFADSLKLSMAFDMSTISYIADVGSGGGFPGIPLKIKYPHLSVVLIEVNQKKVAFLDEVTEQLFLQNAQVYTQDWRTFVRKSSFTIDLLLSRASLRPPELLRALAPSTAYTNSSIVYWASAGWQPDNEKEKKLLQGVVSYVIGDKKRELIVFTNRT